MNTSNQWCRFRTKASKIAMFAVTRLTNCALFVRFLFTAQSHPKMTRNQSMSLASSSIMILDFADLQERIGRNLVRPWMIGNWRKLLSPSIPLPLEISAKLWLPSTTAPPTRLTVVVVTTIIRRNGTIDVFRVLLTKFIVVPVSSLSDLLLFVRVYVLSHILCFNPVGSSTVFT